MSRLVPAVPRHVVAAWLERARELVHRPLSTVQLAAFGAFALRELIGLRGALGFVAPHHDRERLLCALAALNALRAVAPEEEDEPVRCAELEALVAEAELARLRVLRHTQPKRDRPEHALAVQRATEALQATRRSYEEAEREAWVDRWITERRRRWQADQARITAAGLPLSLDETRRQRASLVVGAPT